PGPGHARHRAAGHRPGRGRGPGRRLLAGPQRLQPGRGGRPPGRDMRESLRRAPPKRSLLRISWLENVTFALLAMRAQKLRSFLTLLGVMAGVATVIMMVSFVVGFNNAVTAGFTSFGAYLVQFQKFSPRFGG